METHRKEAKALKISNIIQRELYFNPSKCKKAIKIGDDILVGINHNPPTSYVHLSLGNRMFRLNLDRKKKILIVSTFNHCDIGHNEKLYTINEKDRGNLLHQFGLFVMNYPDIVTTRFVDYKVTAKQLSNDKVRLSEEDIVNEVKSLGLKF